MTREERYYANVRAANKVVWDGINTLKSLQREWNAGDYGNTLSDGSELPGGVNNENAGILAADLGAVVFATADAFGVVLDAGNATNMQKLL